MGHPPEHFHLLVTEPEVGNPSTVMQGLKQRSAHALLPKRRRRDLRQRELFPEEIRRAFWQARFYGFNVSDHEEARGEVTLYASQSGEVRVGRIAGTMALEQLPVLSSRGERCGADQRRLGQDLVSGSGRLKPSLPASVVPAPAKIAGAGHPFFILCVSD